MLNTALLLALIAVVVFLQQWRCRVWTAIKWVVCNYSEEFGLSILHSFTLGKGRIRFLSILLLSLCFDGSITVSSSCALLPSLACFHHQIVLLLEGNVWLHRETNLSASSCCLIMRLWWGKSCVSQISSLIWFVVWLHEQLHWHNGKASSKFWVWEGGNCLKRIWKQFKKHCCQTCRLSQIFLPLSPSPHQSSPVCGKEWGRGPKKWEWDPSDKCCDTSLLYP